MPEFEDLLSAASSVPQAHNPGQQLVHFKAASEWTKFEDRSAQITILRERSQIEDRTISDGAANATATAPDATAALMCASAGRMRTSASLRATGAASLHATTANQEKRHITP